MNILLAGDIGGTNARLALFSSSEKQPELITKTTFPTKDFENFEDVVSTFLDQTNTQVNSACFGVAGPVLNGHCSATNLAWELNERILEQRFNIPSATLLNDLAANAYGINCLTNDDYITLHQGHPEATGNCAIISPGTGLGEAGIFWDSREYHPFSCEGGHTDFGPQGELQFELAKYLSDRVGPVSYEHLLCGSGLINIYHFLRDTGIAEESDWLKEKMAGQNPAACIGQEAKAGNSPLCQQTLDLFIEILAQEAGNLALKTMATGGIWLGGGISAKFADTIINHPTFIQAFTRKPKMAALLERVPVRIILNEHTALLGAAAYANRRTQ